MHAVDHVALHARAGFQAMQVRQGLAEGEDDLVLSRWRGNSTGTMSQPSRLVRRRAIEVVIIQARIVMGDQLIDRVSRPTTGSRKRAAPGHLPAGGGSARPSRPGRRIGGELVGHTPTLVLILGSTWSPRSAR